MLSAKIIDLVLKEKFSIRSCDVLQGITYTPFPLTSLPITTLAIALDLQV